MKEDKDLSLLFDSLYWIKRVNTVYRKNYEDPEDYKDLICKNLENIGISLAKISEKHAHIILTQKKNGRN